MENFPDSMRPWCCALGTELKRKNTEIDSLKESLAKREEEIASLEREIQELKKREREEHLPPVVQALFASYDWFKEDYEILSEHGIITCDGEHLDLHCENKYTVLSQLFCFHIKGNFGLGEDKKAPRVKWSVIAPAFDVPDWVNLAQKATNSNLYTKCKEYKKIEELLIREKERRRHNE